MPKVEIPTPFRLYTGGNAVVEVGGATAGEALENLVEGYPDLERQLYTGDGKLHPSINAYRGEEDIRHLDGLDTRLSDGDTISLIPSIAGGSTERQGN